MESHASEPSKACRSPWSAFRPFKARLSYSIPASPHTVRVSTQGGDAERGGGTGVETRSSEATQGWRRRYARTMLSSDGQMDTSFCRPPRLFDTQVMTVCVDWRLYPGAHPRKSSETSDLRSSTGGKDMPLMGPAHCRGRAGIIAKVRHAWCPLPAHIATTHGKGRVGTKNPGRCAE